MSDSDKNIQERVDDVKKPAIRLQIDEGSPIGYYLVFLAIIVLILAYMAVKAFDLLPESAYGSQANIFSILGILVFVVASLWGLYRSINLKIRDGIVLFLLCSLCFLGYELAWTWYNVMQHNMMPYPSIADVFYVIGHILLILAIILVTRGLVIKPRYDYSLAILMLAASVAMTLIIMFLAHLGIADIYRNSQLNLAFILDIGYPVLDVIALVMVAKLLEVSQTRKVFEAQFMLAVAICALSFTDVYFSIISARGMYEIGSLVDQLYIIAYVIFGLSVWRYVNLTRRDITKDRVSRTTIPMPGGDPEKLSGTEPDLAKK
jgi:hypothetical protein